METSNSNSKIQFKIGMVAPSGSGKTSLISSVCSEVQDRLASEPSLEFWPEGTATQRAMQRANAEFNTAINNPNNLFQVPKLQPTSSISEYQFAVTLPTTKQTIGFSVLDYPGHLLGTSEFSSKVTPHLLESAALFVPISADILMYWGQTNGLTGTYNTQCNAAANMLLDCDNVILAIKNWIAEKRKVEASAQLFFVPIKCEKYFDDNGGRVDSHQKLYEAILERYIKPLEMTKNEEQLIQTNIFFVDTYGVVELRNIEAVMAKDKDNYEQLTLVPTFMRRMDQGKKRRTKNAYELLMSILKFQVENRFKEQQIETSDLSSENEKTKIEIEKRKKRRDVAINNVEKRKNSYGFWASLWYTFFNDDELDRLEEEALKADNDVKETEKKFQSIFDKYKLSAQQCESLEKAVRTLTDLFNNMYNRQYTI